MVKDDEHLSLEKICDALQCEITDVIELTEDTQNNIPNKKTGGR